MSVTTAGGALRIRAPGFTFLEGQPLARLKDGRSVRVELGVMVLPEPGRAHVAAARRVFALSYDLWEERFAVTTVDSRSESISHLTPAAAVAWCIDQLAIPLSSLGAFAADVPFWVRLEYRILDGDGGAEADEDAGSTLQALIDALSRRRRTESSSDALEAGPFRLPRRGGASTRPGGLRRAGPPIAVARGGPMPRSASASAKATADAPVARLTRSADLSA